MDDFVSEFVKELTIKGQDNSTCLFSIEALLRNKFPEKFPKNPEDKRAISYFGSGGGVVEFGGNFNVKKDEIHHFKIKIGKKDYCYKVVIRKISPEEWDIEQKEEQNQERDKMIKYQGFIGYYFTKFSSYIAIALILLVIGLSIYFGFIF